MVLPWSVKAAQYRNLRGGTGGGRYLALQQRCFHRDRIAPLTSCCPHDAGVVEILRERREELAAIGLAFVVRKVSWIATVALRRARYTVADFVTAKAVTSWLY